MGFICHYFTVDDSGYERKVIMPQLSIHIVAWNSLASLPNLFASLEKQTFKDFVVRVVDNGSNDGLEKWLQEKYPQVMLIRNSRNLGLAAALNQMIKYAISKWENEDLNRCYILVVSPDVVLVEDCLAKLVEAAAATPGAGVWAPKILKMFQDNSNDEVLSLGIRSDVIDNVGLQINRFYRFHKRGAGELDRGQHDHESGKEIFGATNIVALYRAAALEAAKLFDHEYFDEDFFIGAEDADLAWRLQNLGWSTIFVPAAVTHHARNLGEMRAVGIRASYKKDSKTQRDLYLARNHQWLLIKNISGFTEQLFLLVVLLFEIPRSLLLSLVWPKKIALLFSMWFGLPKMLKKRQEIFYRRRVYWGNKKV